MGTGPRAYGVRIRPDFLTRGGIGRPKASIAPYFGAYKGRSPEKGSPPPTRPPELLRYAKSPRGEIKSRPLYAPLRAVPLEEGFSGPMGF